MNVWSDRALWHRTVCEWWPINYCKRCFSKQTYLNHAIPIESLYWSVGTYSKTYVDRRLLNLKMHHLRKQTLIHHVNIFIGKGQRPNHTLTNMTYACK